MIPVPVAIWAALNALNCIASITSKEGTKIGFALSLGTAALSCGLLSAGAIVPWLGLEIALWIFHIIITVLASAIRPPGGDEKTLNAIAISASVRLSIAMIVWLCL